MTSSNTPLNNTTELLYVLSKNGVLHIDPNPLGDHYIHHSYIIKGRKNDKMLGVGKAVACAGFLTIKNSRIVEIDNDSGHYQPSTDQLILTVKLLYSRDILNQNCIVYAINPNGGPKEEISLKECLLIPTQAITQKYSTLPTCEMLSIIDDINSLSLLNSHIDFIGQNSVEEMCTD